MGAPVTSSSLDSLSLDQMVTKLGKKINAWDKEEEEGDDDLTGSTQADKLATD